MAAISPEKGNPSWSGEFHEGFHSAVGAGMSCQSSVLAIGEEKILSELLRVEYKV